ncbi:hypothetical protein HanOQP8_Chr02g0044211 [Helianthus annuus]|nr:hypothetical protein HanOQP8_Chr02g0044211 [Helianthus annuus]
MSPLMKPLMMMSKFQLSLLVIWKRGERQRLASPKGRRKGVWKKPLRLLKHRGSDPDDRATLTEMMRKKALEEKKRKLDEQAAAMLASKKARLQKETPPAPSESEIDLGAFTATHGNLLEKIYEASVLQV